MTMPALDKSSAGRPRYDFQHVIDRLEAGQDPRSPLALVIGSKGYHPSGFSEGPYPVD